VLRDRIIKFLGGATKEEYMLLNELNNNQMESLKSAEEKYNSFLIKTKDRNDYFNNSLEQSNKLNDLLGNDLKESEEKYKLLNIEYNQQHDLVVTYRAREEELNKRFQEEVFERKRLQEIIFKKFGIIEPEESEQSSPTTFRPMNTAPRRWSQLKNSMEKDDFERVKSAQKA